MKRAYVSFDVFDTCLIRRCGLPEKIWDLMADRLFDVIDIRGRLSFTGNRGMAEKAAALKTPYPSLEDIYKELNVAQWGFSQDFVKNLEMEIEEQELFPNPEMLRIVDDYREKDFKVAFISDMYLPTDFIKGILQKKGFFKDGDLVLVSAGCHAGKFDGKIFDYLFKLTGTRAKQWHHFGDNERSDFQIPKSKGIKAHLVCDTAFTEEEKRWLSDARFYSHKHEIELWTGACRLTRLQNERNFAATMAVDFIASVYVPYVMYVLRKAEEKGLKTLCFLARDGHIFYEIANALKKEGDDIECKYLKLSRRAIHKCIFYNVDDFELSMVVGNALNQTVDNVMKFIGIDYGDLDADTKKKFPQNFALNNKKRVQNFSDALKRNVEIIKAASKKNRDLFLTYLKQEGVLDSDAAMVDLGWVGSCRCIINYIMRKEGYNVVPTFYWGYNKSLIYGDKSDDLYVFNKQYDLIEECSCSNLFLEEYASLISSGTTIGYKYDKNFVQPIEDAGNSAVAELSSLNEKMAVEVSKQAESCIKWNSGAIEDVFLCCGLKQMNGILKNPNKKQLALFLNVDFENYSKKFKMVRRLPLKDVIALLVWGIPATPIWTEGAIVVTFGRFANAFVNLYKCSSKTLVAKWLRTWWENRG